MLKYGIEVFFTNFSTDTNREVHSACKYPKVFKLIKIMLILHVQAEQAVSPGEAWYRTYGTLFL